MKNMYACIIMHNVTVVNKGDDAKNWEDDVGVSSSSGEFQARQGVSSNFATAIQRHAELHDARAHLKLEEDMIAKIWTCFGSNYYLFFQKCVL